MKKIIDFLSLLMAARTPQPSSGAPLRDTPLDRLYQPNPTFLPGAAKKPFDVVIEPSIDSSFRGIEWVKDDELNAKLFEVGFNDSRFTTLSELIDTAIPSCGGTTLKSLAVNVTKLDSMVWANDREHKGFTHHGPCEAWIDSTRVYNSRDCLASNDKWPAEIKVNYSVCKGTCSFRFYWLSTDSAPEWHGYKQCTLITTAIAKPFKPKRTPAKTPHLRTPTPTKETTATPQHSTHPVSTPQISFSGSDSDKEDSLHLDSSYSHPSYSNNPANITNKNSGGSVPIMPGSIGVSDSQQKPEVSKLSLEDGSWYDVPAVHPISTAVGIAYIHPHLGFHQDSSSKVFEDEASGAKDALGDGPDREQRQINYNLGLPGAISSDKPCQPFRCDVTAAGPILEAHDSTVSTQNQQLNTTFEDERSMASIGKKNYPVLESHQSPRLVYLSEKLDGEQYHRSSEDSMKIPYGSQFFRDIDKVYEQQPSTAQVIGRRDTPQLLADPRSDQSLTHLRPLLFQPNALMQQQQMQGRYRPFDQENTGGVAAGSDYIPNNEEFAAAFGELFPYKVMLEHQRHEGIRE